MTEASGTTQRGIENIPGATASTLGAVIAGAEVAGITTGVGAGI